MKDGSLFRVLTLNEISCVTNCICCDKIQMGFGNVLMTLNAQEFSQFKENVVHVYEMNCVEMQTTDKRVYLNLNLQKTVLVFNLEELSSLKNLLLEASLL